MERRMIIMLGVITFMIAGLVVMIEIGEAGGSRGGPCKLSGDIEDTNGNNLKDVLIEIWNGSILHNQTYTDEDGYFVIIDIPETTEEWKVVVRKDGYKTNVMSFIIGRNSIHNVDLEDSDILYVDDDAPDGGNGSVEYPYKVIQDAINASDDGDTICVFDGTYYENVMVYKPVNLIGNGSEMTTIDGGGDGDVVNITANRVNMSGFLMTGSGDGRWDSGIRVESDSNHIFNNNCSNSSIGINVLNSNDCTVTNNTCENNDKYAINLEHSNLCTIANNTCSSNNDHGISLYSSNDLTIKYNTCSSNNRDGIHLWESSACTIENNTISGNMWGLFLASSSQNNTVHHNNIYDNSVYGIDASPNNGYEINATNNWWGDDSGPYHPILNENGMGDNVTDNVLFDPWMGKEELETGSLSGYVKDPYGTPLEGATINITCDGFSSETTSNDTGQYEITGIPILECIWTITASKYGYDGARMERSIDEDSIQNFTLLRISITWYVDDDAPPGGNGSLKHPFSRIQDAINNATDWDTIRVFNGTYYENVVIYKTVGLIGNGSETTTIDGGGDGDVVTITADWVNMSGFSVTGSEHPGAGIKVEADNIRILHNNCSNNDRGIYLHRYSNTCIIMYNNCSNNKNGFFLFYSSNCTLENNTCSLNNGDGISLDSSSDCTITNNTCSANTRNGISLFYSSNCTLESNSYSSNNRFGIVLTSSSDCTLRKNTISENSVGIYLRASNRNNTVHNNNIYNNTDFGINATNNGGYKIVATKNWWGDSSGPYHSENNSMGRGDNITDYVDFNPWLDKHGNLVYLPNEPDDDDDEPNRIPLYILLGILIALFTALAVVAHTSGLTSTSKAFKTRQLPASEPTWDSSDVMKINGKMITCEYCHQGFDVAKNEKAIRVPCPKCGKYTLNS